MNEATQLPDAQPPVVAAKIFCDWCGLAIQDTTRARHFWYLDEESLSWVRIFTHDECVSPFAAANGCQPEVGGVLADLLEETARNARQAAREEAV